ncbi:MAG: spermine/spermidine synthase domain-containing protein [Aeromicrobium sp.]
MSGASLRRRDDGAVELRVNGVFVMDDVETSSERALARSVLDAGAGEVLVGGLGLGFTARELLADSEVTRVIVAELHAEIARWMRDGMIAGAELLADPRFKLHIGDVQDIVASLPPISLDAILLDVDNGPDFLVYEDNAAVYQSAFIKVCAERLRAGGHLSLWSQADSPPLRTVLAEHFAEVSAESLPVTLQDRAEDYWILRGTGPKAPR